MLNFKFSDPGHLPPPVLAFHDVSFGYPGCAALYSNVNFGVDLDSRVALVGPNGAGKTTLVKLMAGELNPSMGKYGNVQEMYPMLSQCVSHSL